MQGRKEAKETETAATKDDINCQTLSVWRMKMMMTISFGKDKSPIKVANVESTLRLSSSLMSNFAATKTTVTKQM